MQQKFILITALCALQFLACNSSSPNSATTKQENPTRLAVRENQLSLKINGVEWKADHNIMGAFHPKGYNKAIIIAGSKGPKDKNEQVFSLNLFNTEGPASFQIKNGNPEYHVVQLANLSPQNYLYGSILGFDMKVNILKASETEIEATFEGTLTGNAHDQLRITEGRFYYHEN